MVSRPNYLNELVNIDRKVGHDMYIPRHEYLKECFLSVKNDLQKYSINSYFTHTENRHNIIRKIQFNLETNVYISEERTDFRLLQSNQIAFAIYTLLEYSALSEELMNYWYKDDDLMYRLELIKKQGRFLGLRLHII